VGGGIEESSKLGAGKRRKYWLQVRHTRVGCSMKIDCRSTSVMNTANAAMENDTQCRWNEPPALGCVLHCCIGRIHYAQHTKNPLSSEARNKESMEIKKDKCETSKARSFRYLMFVCLNFHALLIYRHRKRRRQGSTVFHRKHEIRQVQNTQRRGLRRGKRVGKRGGGGGKYRLVVSSGKGVRGGEL
jgi:hypothetical protein